MLSKKEIKQKQLQAKEHKGISYEARLDKFAVWYRIDTDIHGKPIYFKPIKRFATIEAALEWLEEVKKMSSAGIDSQKKVTLETLFERYNKNFNEVKTIGVRTAYRAIENFDIVRKDVSSLTTKDFQLVFDKLSETKQRSTLITYRNNLHRMIYKQIAFLEQSGITSISQHLLKINLPEPAPGVKEDKSYSLSELNKILNYALNSGDDRVIMLVQLLIMTGTRISEAIGIKVCNVDLCKKEILIEWQKDRHNSKNTALTKTKDARIIPIPTVLAVNLYNYITAKNLNDNDFIIDVNQDSARNHWLKEAEEQAGVKHIENSMSHRFRHSLVTHLSARGVDVRKIVGHASGGEIINDVHFNTYTHLDDKTKERFRIAVENYYNAVRLGKSDFDVTASVYSKCLRDRFKEKICEVEQNISVICQSVWNAEYISMSRSERKNINKEQFINERLEKLFEEDLDYVKIIEKADSLVFIIKDIQVEDAKNIDKILRMAFNNYVTDLYKENHHYGDFRSDVRDGLHDDMLSLLLVEIADFLQDRDALFYEPNFSLEMIMARDAFVNLRESEGVEKTIED